MQFTKMNSKKLERIREKCAQKWRMKWKKMMTNEKKRRKRLEWNTPFLLIRLMSWLMPTMYSFKIVSNASKYIKFPLPFHFILDSSSTQLSTCNSKPKCTYSSVRACRHKQIKSRNVYGFFSLLVRSSVNSIKWTSCFREAFYFHLSTKANAYEWRSKLQVKATQYFLFID